MTTNTVYGSWLMNSQPPCPVCLQKLFAASKWWYIAVVIMAESKYDRQALLDSHDLLVMSCLIPKMLVKPSSPAIAEAKPSWNHQRLLLHNRVDDDMYMNNHIMYLNWFVHKCCTLIAAWFPIIHDHLQMGGGYHHHLWTYPYGDGSNPCTDGSSPQMTPS